MEAPTGSRVARRGLSGRALGLALIFLTSLIWVAASFLSQLLVSTEEGKPSYNVSPFLLTYLSTSIFTIFLPLVQLKSLLQETWLLRRGFQYKPLDLQERESEDEGALLGHAAPSGGDGGAGSSSGVGAALGSLEADLDAAEAAAAAEQAAAAAARESAAAHKESLLAAAQCFLFWFAAQYLFNVSLSLTSVTSNTILSSTSSLFTFALSMVVLREPYSAAKLLSIAACMGGTLLVTISDQSGGGGGGGQEGGGGGGPSHSVWGDLVCLVSASFYAAYTIVLRKSLPDEEEASVALFFGYVGLLCSAAFAPVLAALAGTGALRLASVPPKAYLIILVEGVLNYCLSDYLWAHAVLLLGPTVATLGLSVQIPVAAAVEALLGRARWLSSGRAAAMTLGGTALIMAGFFCGNLAGGGAVAGSHHRGEDPQQQQQQQQQRSPLPRRGHPSANGLQLVMEEGGDAFGLAQPGAVVVPVSVPGERRGGAAAAGGEHGRLSIEMSSLEDDGLSSGSSGGQHSAGSSPTHGGSGGSGGSGGAADGGGSPGRQARRSHRASRLQRSAHYLDGQTPPGSPRGGCASK